MQPRFGFVEVDVEGWYRQTTYSFIELDFYRSPKVAFQEYRLATDYRPRDKAGVGNVLVLNVQTLRPYGLTDFAHLPTLFANDVKYCLNFARVR